MNLNSFFEIRGTAKIDFKISPSSSQKYGVNFFRINTNRILSETGSFTMLCIFFQLARKILCFSFIFLARFRSLLHDLRASVNSPFNV